MGHQPVHPDVEEHDEGAADVLADFGVVVGGLNPIPKKNDF